MCGLRLYHVAGDIFKVLVKRILPTYNGRSINKTRTLAKQNFVNDSTVFMVVKGYGGGKQSSQSQTSSGNINFIILCGYICYLL